MAPALFPEEVKNSPLFTGISEQDKNLLLAYGQIRKIHKGEMLYIHAEPATNFYIICNGTIKLFREDVNGHEKTIDILTAGNTLCEKEFFDHLKIHRANAQAVTDAILMEFPVSWLKQSSQKYSIFALNLLSAISENVHTAQIEAEHLATMSSAQLVACFLKRMCVLYNFDPREFELPYSKSLIASRLGMEVETFSRTLSILRDNGITVSGTKVRFTDLAAIENYVCSTCSAAGECPTHKNLQNNITKKPSNYA